MSSRLSRFLGLAEGELRPVLGLSLLYGCVGGAVAVGDATVQSVFVARAGADALPHVLLARALISPLLAWLYARLARPRSAEGVMIGVTLLAGAAEIGCRFLMLGHETGPLLSYVIHDALGSVVTVHWGVYLLSRLPGDGALRGAPAIYAAARLGAALAGAALAPLVSVQAVPIGMFLAGALYLGAGVTARFVSHEAEGARPSEPTDETRAHVAPTDEEDVRPSVRPERQRGLRMLLESPLLAALAASTAVMVAVRFALRYQQQSMLEALPEAELATLLAYYTIAANVLGGVLQVLLLGRVLRRLGLGATNGIYAIFALATQAFLVFVPGVPSALVARFTDNELKHSLKTPLSTLFYDAFAPSDRGAARALVLGVVSPVAQVAGALGLAVAVAGASVEAIGWTGLAACALFGLATWWQNRSYARAPARSAQPRAD